MTEITDLSTVINKYIVIDKRGEKIEAIVKKILDRIMFYVPKRNLIIEFINTEGVIFYEQNGNLPNYNEPRQRKGSKGNI